MKRPSFQFYPSDWLRDTALRSCSTGARGLWIDMICFMHEGNPYGHLKVGNKVILPINLASMVGATLQDVEGWLDELFQAGVFDMSDEGAIFSRRMIRDEALRKVRAEGGKLGGNPALKVNHKVEKEDKQKSTPSSSSSSSNVNTPKAPTGADDRFERFWKAYPKKVGKDAAKRAFGKRKPDETMLIAMLDAIVWQSRSEAWVKEGGAYIPNPATWLNQGRWQDEPGNRSTDVARQTVPSRPERDPTLVKIEEDRAKAAPIPQAIREKLQALKGGVL